MQNRTQHQPEVQRFLQTHFPTQSWEFTLPNGSGSETYLAQAAGQTIFIKVGVQTARYQMMASLGLTPQVLAAGLLEDGASIMVQPCITGRNPSRKDYHNHLEQIATIIHRTHHSSELRQVLPPVSSDLYRSAGLEALTRIQKRWQTQAARVSELDNRAAAFVEQSLADLEQQVQHFTGSGLVASHNDICNANWLITPDEQIYLIDLESMELDDPALDLGATLWWYYPPAMRRRFLELSGYAGDPTFHFRMRVRMAMHCLAILLPRQQSFDTFDPAAFAGSLTDFKAVMAGQENPQGYTDGLDLS